MPESPTAVQREDSAAFFLPDFCSSSAALAVVLIVELVAILVAISRQAPQISFWLDLAGASIFLLWIGLVSAAVLCRARRWLMQMTIPRASAVAIALLLATVGIISEVVYQLGRFWSGGIDTSALFPGDHLGFVARNLVIGFIVSSLALRYFHVSAEWKRSVQLEARARIRALQARIRPHFLFNSMNTIAALTRSDPQGAEQAVEDLADLFRANLSDARNQIPLKEELEVARIYQRIEQLRLGERLKVRWNVADLPMRALVPSLLVQPLLENAVYHGIEALADGGLVTINGSFDGEKIQLQVCNPLPEQQVSPAREGNQVAIDNIQQRLALAWPGKSSVEVRRENGEYRVTLTFPYQEMHG